jgi:YidC/Oxa1 family membrane protein insertase
MDRNSIIGLVIIVGLIIGYSIFTQPSKEQMEAARKKQDSITLVQQQLAIKAQQEKVQAQLKDSLAPQLTDSSINKQKAEKYGVFAAAAKDSNSFITIENNLIKLKISAKGGRPYSVEMKNYTRYDSSAVVLFNGDSTKFGLNFFSQNRSISTNDLNFEPVQKRQAVIVSSQKDSISLRLYAGEKSYIEYTYTLKPGDYMVHFNVNFVNMNNLISGNGSTLDMIWDMYVPRQEKGADNENTYTNIQYKHFEDEDESMGASKTESKEIPTKLKWIAFKQQFFSTIFIADKSFSNAKLTSEAFENKDKFLKHYSANIAIAIEDKSMYSFPMSMYFGPNHYKTLKKYDLDMENTIFLGRWIIRWINQGVIIPIFNWLSGFISNFGIIILILTLLIKMVLFPLTYKSYQSQAKMRVLKPQIDEINNRIPKEKAMERQQATMALYRKAGVNPMGGCLPMLLQFPILIAMFRFFPTSIELRHQGFLWATDLSTYDSILTLPFKIPFYGDHVSLFTILMTVTTIISMKFTNTMQNDNQIPGMKTMMYIMPVMFMFMLNSFSSGLTYYYFLANVITIGQNEIFKLMIDEQKLLKQIHANKAKPVKKSAWQERMKKMARDRGYQLPKKN